MLPGAVFLVILSGLIHSIWNLFTKKSVNKNVFLWFCQWAAIVVFLPFAAMEMSTIDSLPLTGWLLVLSSMFFHGMYVLLLARAYSIGDLSQVYPIMRGIGPFFVPIVGVVLLNENLKLLGWIGVLCIVVGILLAGDVLSRRKRFSFNRSTMLAIGVGVMITVYTVIDKVTLQYIPPITLNEATNVGNLIVLTFVVMRSGGIRHEWKINWKTIVLGGVLAPGGYVLFLNALELMPVSQLAPMREIGTVFGTLFGIFLLNEPQGRNRITASVIITIGVILLAQ